MLADEVNRLIRAQRERAEKAEAERNRLKEECDTYQQEWVLGIRGE